MERRLADYSPWGHRVKHNLVTKQQQYIYLFIYYSGVYGLLTVGLLLLQSMGSGHMGFSSY